MSFTDGLQEFLLAVRCTLKDGIDGVAKKRYESAQTILKKCGFTHYKDRETVLTKTINQARILVIVELDGGNGSVEVIKDGKHLLNESYGKIPLRGDGEGFIAMLNDRFLNSFNCSITLDAGGGNKNNR